MTAWNQLLSMYLVKLQMYMWQLNESKGNSKKTIVCFINREHCEYALVNRKKLKFFNSESIGLPNFKLHFNENLKEYNNTLAFYGRKLKGAGLINSTYTLNGTVHVLRTVGERLIKVFHVSKQLELYPNFEFSNNEGDVLGDASIQSSYWSIIIFWWNILCL